MAADGGPLPEPTSLRERKRLRLRRDILEAVAELELVHGGAIDPSLITYARIAEIAGVSERTVYRMFPTKADLDEAYAAENPIGLGLPVPDDPRLADYPDLIEAIGAAWADRTGDRRVDEHEVDADDYPVSMAMRRARDAEMVRRMREVVPPDTGLGDRQLLALTAAVHSTISMRSIAITAQRWNLTVAEATRAHAWAMRTLLEALRTAAPEPWEGDHAADRDR